MPAFLGKRSKPARPKAIAAAIRHPRTVCDAVGVFAQSLLILSKTLMQFDKQGVKIGLFFKQRISKGKQ